MTSNCPSAGGVVVLTSEAVPYTPLIPECRASVPSTSARRPRPRRRRRRQQPPPRAGSGATTGSGATATGSGAASPIPVQGSTALPVGTELIAGHRDHHRLGVQPHRLLRFLQALRPARKVRLPSTRHPAPAKRHTGSPTATAANVQPQPIVAANLPEPLPARGTQTLDRLTALVLGGMLFFLARAIWRKVGWVSADVTLATSRPPDEMAPTVGASPGRRRRRAALLARAPPRRLARIGFGRRGRPGRPVLGLCRPDRSRLVPEPPAGADARRSTTRPRPGSRRPGSRWACWRTPPSGSRSWSPRATARRCCAAVPVTGPTPPCPAPSATAWSTVTPRIGVPVRAAQPRFDRPETVPPGPVRGLQRPGRPDRLLHLHRDLGRDRRRQRRRRPGLLRPTTG